MAEQIPASEYNALVDLYNSTGGPQWINHTGWLDPSTTGWFNVFLVLGQCDHSGHVRGLYLNDNQLTGSIPPSLGQLSQLTQLFLGANYLAGSIPASLGQLSQLGDLSLYGNYLTGSIPASLGQLSQLGNLSLNSNQLTGSIPASLGQLSQLGNLSLQGNQLTGSIPASLGQLSQLHYLDISYNQLTGSLPMQLAQLTQLGQFRLGFNCLSLDDHTSQSVITTLQDAGVTVFYLPQNCNGSGLQVSLIRCNSADAYSNAAGGVDDPLIPQPSPAILTRQPVISRGVVADGVTPLVFRIEQNMVASASYNVTVDNPGLSPRIRILSGSVWSNSPIITFDGTNTTGFAYMDGVIPDAVFASGQTELSVTLTLTNTQDPTDVTTKTFYVRRPPIFLVHGYNADGSSWGDEFLNALAAATFYDPFDASNSFIRPVSYGVAHNFNTWGSFAELVPALDGVLSVEENFLHNDWAFTRYDVVAHSQGGILTRLLCGQNGTYLARKFKGPANFNRGRFRRVITIGSPHNGSTLAYYVSHLNGDLYRAIPYFLKNLLQPKFDPFGDQIHAINDASANVDPYAKFSVITATINGGDVTHLLSPLAYRAIGLNQFSIHEPPQTRGKVVLRTGSDGVVDIQSERAGTGTPLTEIQGVNISHFMPPGGPLADIALFGALTSETTDAQVASTTATLLTGPDGNFGAFQRPIDLSPARKAEIDAEIPLSAIIDLINPLPLHALHRPARLPHGVSSYTFIFTPDPSEPLDGNASWYGEVFSPEGVTTAGLTVTPDPSDSTHVTVDVDDSVRGDVALYLSYSSTTGHLIFSRPVLVTSIPPGANLIGIELHPNPITAMVGDAIGLEIWGRYDNGSASQLFVQPENSTFSSSNPNVASVDSGTGQLRAVRPGQATITATYGGLTNEATIRVAFSPAPRPAPPPHVTPVPPPPSPRPTAVPRPTPPPHLTPVPSPTSPRPTPAPRP